MLWWAASVFEHELSARDGDGAKQGFAFISFAQASANLLAWVTSERADGQPSGRRGDIFRELMDQIVWSHELRAIAEAARHAKIASPYWGGENVPVLRGEDGRLVELDDHSEQQDWFQNLTRGLADGSLWFENSLDGTDARTVIVAHCQAWDENLIRLRTG